MGRPRKPPLKLQATKDIGESLGDFSVPAPRSMPEIPKTPKVRQSGHFVEQKLRYKTPYQPTLFDALSSDTLGKVEKYELKAEGIRLTTAEERLLNTLYRLLRDTSKTTKDTGSPDFYAGNVESRMIPYGGADQKSRSVHIRIARADLYKAYLDNPDYSGKEIQEINKTLERLAEKRFLLKYDRVRKVKVGSREENRTDRIEEVQSLVRVVNFTKDLTDAEVLRLNGGDEAIRQAKGELVIAFNPILTDQINSKYVEYPEDINRRTVLAAGGNPNKVTESMVRLRDYLMQAISAKRYRIELNKERLPYVLGLENYVAQGRKKLLAESIARDFQAAKNLGLLLDVEETVGAEGQDKLVFTLNKDFE